MEKQESRVLKAGNKELKSYLNSVKIREGNAQEWHLYARRLESGIKMFSTIVDSLTDEGNKTG